MLDGRCSEHKKKWSWRARRGNATPTFAERTAEKENTKATITTMNTIRTAENETYETNATSINAAIGATGRALAWLKQQKKGGADHIFQCGSWFRTGACTRVQMASAGSFSRRLQLALSSLERKNQVKHQFHPGVFIRSLEELQTSFKDHAQSILTDERGKQHAHDIEEVGYNSMIQELDASTGDLNKRSRDATVAKPACAAGVEHGLFEVKGMRGLLSTVRSEEAELGVKTIKSPLSQTMEKVVAQFHDDKAHSSPSAS